MSRFRIDKATVVLLISVAALVAAYTATVWLSNRYYVVSAPKSSVYSASPAGFKVYYTYLEQLGHKPAIAQTLEGLPASATLIAAGPFDKTPATADGRLLGTWVRGGGRLVAVGADAGALLEQIGVGGSPSSIDTSEALRPLFPGVYSLGVTTVAPGPDRLLVDAAGWVAHYKDSAGQVLVSQQVGRGEVVWLAGPYPMSNAGIGQASNAALAVDLALAGGRQVVFDEYHHGYVREAGYWARLWPGGRSAVLLLAAALGIVLVARARRLGPAIPGVEPVSARGGAYIGQLAELYRKAGARKEALASLEEGLTRALVRVHGSLEAGLGRHPSARRALDESRAARETGEMTGEGFVQTARALAGARREVEGQDG
jgi:hypothetical protein